MIVYSLNNLPPKVRTENNKPSKTKKEFAKEVNINQIIKRAKKYGLPMDNDKKGIYADVSNLPNYQEAFDFVRQADNDFMKMPSEIRNRFDNNPHKMINFLRDPNNLEESIKLGLREKKVPPPADPDPATVPDNPPAPDPEA